MRFASRNNERAPDDRRGDRGRCHGRGLLAGIGLGAGFGRGHHGRHGGRHDAGRYGDDHDGFGGPGFGGGPFGGGPFGGGRFGGGRFGGGKGRGRMFAGGELRLLLLSLVAEQERHGYELIKAIEELAGGAYAPSPGVVYPTLALLVDEGMIAEAQGTGPRKAFTVTDSGRAELAGRADELQRIVDRLGALARQGERSDSPPLRRAVANLMVALRQRAMGRGFDADTALKIADILDAAAREIERL